MLSGQYNFLVDNLWLAEIVAVILLIIPFFLVFADKKWIFGYYIISIVANLPLIFQLAFGFSYELIIGLAVIFSILRDLIQNKNLLIMSTKESRALVLSLFGILILNLLTSLFNFSKSAFFERSFIYLVNIFILFIFSYFLINRERLQVFRYSFVIGALILVFFMIVELIYGHYFLHIRRLRPAGLLLDPNVAAFALNISLILSFYKTKKQGMFKDIFFILARVLIVFGVFMTVSRSGYLSTLLILSAFLIYYSKDKNSYIAPITVLVFIFMYFVFQNMIYKSFDSLYQMLDLERVFPRKDLSLVPGGPSAPGDLPSDEVFTDSRIILLKAGIKIFLNNYRFGVGIGNITVEVNNLTSLPMNTHNLLIQLLAESGIIILGAILIFLYYLVVLIKRSKNKQRFFLILISIVIFLEALFNHNLLNLNIIYLLFSFFLSLNILFSKEQLVLSLSKIRNRIRR